jgi:hypothetical protein
MCTKTLMGKPEEKRPLGRKERDRRIILKCILNKEDVRV